MILIFFEALDAALEDPKMRALVVSVTRKLWDAFNNDPAYESNLEVQEKTLSAADSTVKEKQDALQAIADSHPKT
jgi:hypothetical protein